MEAEIGRQNCPKTNALIPTSSRAVVRGTFDRLCSTGRVTEAWNTWNARQYADQKEESHYGRSNPDRDWRGWRIFFREVFYGEAVEKNASRVA